MLAKWKDFENILNIKISEKQKQQLLTYFEILVNENQKYNLTRITNFEDVFYKHFIDSLLFTKDIKITNQRILDIGTGAGFPGIVLKIMFPETEITLLDSSNKKIYFLNIVIQKLELKKIKAVQERAEIFARKENENYDIVISRAVAYMDIILELSSRLVRIKGIIILLKGPKSNEEYENSKSIIKKLKISFLKNFESNFSKIGKRSNWVFLKNDSTPDLYPRDFSKILKESAKNDV